MPAMVPASRTMKTPAARDEVQSAWVRPAAARWVATRDEEQAVWVLMQGPCSPNV